MVIIKKIVDLVEIQIGSPPSIPWYGRWRLIGSPLDQSLWSPPDKPYSSDSSTQNSYSSIINITEPVSSRQIHPHNSGVKNVTSCFLLFFYSLFFICNIFHFHLSLLILCPSIIFIKNKSLFFPSLLTFLETKQNHKRNW